MLVDACLTAQASISEIGVSSNCQVLLSIWHLVPELMAWPIPEPLGSPEGQMQWVGHGFLN